ncbi:hypothetical protein [Sinorhizobium americanum]|uniref:hypothetical protein n=1 Tax=Sinorhizobium americanum TaxID=194963 RepID=UPI000AD708C8|nr:hypothetical protein [Sinorhizobium americanum]
MNVLIWTTPWPTQGGELYFGYNAFVGHLLKQGKTLAEAGCAVHVAFPDTFTSFLRDKNFNANFIELNALESTKIVGGWTDPSQELYELGPAADVSQRISTWLRPHLPEEIDVVLCWETPVPYLRSLYPEALIINQMPGQFSRTPYPHTVIFDNEGLYKKGTLFKSAASIIKVGETTNLASSFSATAKGLFRKYPFPVRNKLARTGKTNFNLLPLQISEHYAFRGDTGFVSQAQFCVEALSSVPDEPVYVTQYISRLYRDTVMTPQFVNYLETHFPNVIYDAATEKLSSVSQHVLPQCSQLLVASSGIGIQALIWDVPLKVIGDTFLRPFDKKELTTTVERNRVLSFVLGRHAPLANKVVNDGGFITALIEEMRSRQGLVGVERYPRFSDLDSLYEDKLLSSFTEGDIAKVYQSIKLSPTPVSKAQQFSGLIQKHQPKLISFDLFDTLVIRGFEAPADLYKLLEYDLRAKMQHVPFDLAGKRLTAELKARTEAEGEEITLRDIYTCLAASENIPAELCEKIMEREIELEIKACQPRPIGIEMLRIARATGTPVCITSDMYLPRHAIDSILSATLVEVDQVYLSTEIGLTKKSGSLFDFITTERKLNNKDVVHVGDTLKTDIEPATKRGITAFHIPKSTEYLRSHPYFSKTFGKRPPITGLGRSVIASAIAHKMFDDPKQVATDSIAKGDPWLLGYNVLGPLVLGFVSWVRRRAVEDNVSTLYFLAREGRIFKDVFDRLELENYSGVESKYLLGSRRCIRVAQLKSLPDILELSGQTIDRHASLRSLLEGRFGLSAITVPQSDIAEAGFTTIDDVIQEVPNWSSKLKLLLGLLSEAILAQSEQERSNYEAYLTSVGFVASQENAVVDVGWNANMQGSLGDLVGEPLRGYYFATLEAASRWRAQGHLIHGYYAENCTITDDDEILSTRLLLEHMLCDLIPSVLSIKRRGLEFKPDFGRNHVSEQRLDLVAPIQEGAKCFVDDICRTLGSNIDAVDFRPDVMAALMKTFLATPAPSDAALFLGQPLDDSFSGAQRRYLVAPQVDKSILNTTPSYWLAGAQAIRSRKSPGRNESPKISPTELLAEPTTGKRRNGSHQSLPAVTNGRESLRSRIVLSVAYPILKPHLTDNERNSYKSNPTVYFNRVKHPILRAVGKAAGLRR